MLGLSSGQLYIDENVKINRHGDKSQREGAIRFLALDEYEMRCAKYANNLLAFIHFDHHLTLIHF